MRVFTDPYYPVKGHCLYTGEYGSLKTRTLAYFMTYSSQSNNSDKKQSFYGVFLYTEILGKFREKHSQLSFLSVKVQAVTLQLHQACFPDNCLKLITAALWKTCKQLVLIQ